RLASLFLRLQLPPRPTLFPYTTLFRSLPRDRAPEGQEPAAYGAGDRHLQPAVHVARELLRDRDHPGQRAAEVLRQPDLGSRDARDRKSTRLNSSHVSTSYAVFCLKKKT